MLVGSRLETRAEGRVGRWRREIGRTRGALRDRGGLRVLGLDGQSARFEQVAVVRAAGGIGRRCARDGCVGKSGVVASVVSWMEWARQKEKQAVDG